MRVFVCAALVAVLLLVVPAWAVADWSAPQSVWAPAWSAPYAVAVDARGDVAIARAAAGGSPARGYTFRTALSITVRTASGDVSTRRVWSSNDAATGFGVAGAGASITIDRRGEITVVWASFTRAQEDHGTQTVRAAYGPLHGRWAPARVIGHSSTGGYPPVPYYPRLAVAPSGEVLGAWNAEHPHGNRGVDVAWRAPGQRFGVPRGLPAAPRGAVPQFDARGTAYLSGFCNALVLSAPAHTHHFGRPVALTSSPVLSFSLSLSGGGDGLAAWVRGGCSFDEDAGDTPGPVYFSVLHAGTFTKPTALTSAAIEAAYSNAVATPGGGTLTWVSNYLPPASPGAFGRPGAFSHQVGADGHAGPAQPITNGLVALTADGGGDLMFAPPVDYFQQLPGFGPPNPVFVRPAGGGADQPAAATSGQIAVAAPTGRAAALAWNTSPSGIGGSLAFSVWRP